MRGAVRPGTIAMPALAVVAAGAGCVPTPAVPVAASTVEVEEAFAGHSYVGTLPDGSSVCIHHAEDGRFLGRAGGLVSGSWSVEEDGLCYAYVQGPPRPDCRQVVLAGNRVVLLFAEVVIGEGHLAEGNVCA
jgi:hypothetical protein